MSLVGLTRVNSTYTCITIILADSGKEIKLMFLKLKKEIDFLPNYSRNPVRANQGANQGQCPFKHQGSWVKIVKGAGSIKLKSGSRKHNFCQ